jgi:hypothetical protein
MRPFARTLASLLAVGAIALAGGAPAVLAAPGESAQPYVLDLKDAWCFDDSPGYGYCFEVVGKAHFQANKNGETLVVNQRLTTTYYMNGVQVGVAVENSLLRGVYRADGTQTSKEVINNKSTFYGESCQYHGVYYIADFELQIDHSHFHCGSAAD